MYRVILLGDPPTDIVAQIKAELEQAVRSFKLKPGRDLVWQAGGPIPPPSGEATCCLYFGSSPFRSEYVADVLSYGHPVLPVVSSLANASVELPPALLPFNALGIAQSKVPVIAMAVLEGLGLLPKQRRVFISYTRTEASAAAVQLFDELSSRHFDVFLDTHGVPPGEDFQAVLWHRLCDADLLVMLDTPGYFNRRWTQAEFGRALAKGISIVRIAWPGAPAPAAAGLASSVTLTPASFKLGGKQFSKRTLTKVAELIETQRSRGYAVRQTNLISTIKHAVERINGSFLGVGPRRAVLLKTPSGKEVAAVPAVGVPTSRALHEAHMLAGGASSIVVYDHVGFHKAWQEHMDWLGSVIKTPRWVKAAEVSWDLAGDDFS